MTNQGNAMSAAQDEPWPLEGRSEIAVAAHVTEVSGQEWHFGLVQDADRYAWHVAEIADSGWKTRPVGDPHGSVRQAVTTNLFLTIGKGRTLDIHCRPEHTQAVLTGIVPPKPQAEDGEGWPDDVVSRWSGYEDYLTVDVPHLKAWAEINDATVLLVTRNGAPGVVPVLYDVDEGDFVGLPTLVETSWFSDGGGAPISWNGGSRLSRLGSGLLVGSAWGDTRQGMEVIEAAGPQETAQAAAAFILADDQQFAAAWELEPFDPDGRLTPADATRWRELREQVEVSVSVYLEPYEELPVLREQLRHDRGYAWVAGALQDPTSESGQALLAKVEDASSSGVIGELMGYAL
jgi:hypothetical protein